MQTPHSGYHWRSEPSFFEGWYYRLTLPAENTTLAFMYSIQDPAGGTPYSGGMAQILGPNEQYFCRSFPDVQQFWAWREALGHGHWRNPKLAGGATYLDPDQFEQQAIEGYQVNANLHQGLLKNPSAGDTIRWRYMIEPRDGWGDRDGNQQATAGWLSHFPIFEPGWQILMAHGLATGWISMAGKQYNFTQAPAYSEKNWGKSFPQRWFWLNCNAFDTDADVAITAGGGRRQVLGWMESVGMVGLHYQGKFYEFAPWNSQVSWSVSPWGYWSMQGKSDRFSIEVQGHTDKPGTWVRTPTATGLEFICRDTTQGHLAIQLWDIRGSRSKVLLNATSQLACLEVGGSPWNQDWVVEQSGGRRLIEPLSQ